MLIISGTGQFLDDPNINTFISQGEEWNPEEYILSKEQKEDTDYVKKRKVLSRVWEDLAEEERKEIDRGQGPGGTKENPGRKSYWVVVERACTLFQKYWNLPEILED